MDARNLARFPFLREASEFVRSYGVSIQELLEGIAYEEARERGMARALDALEKGEVSNRPIATELDRVQEILSYPIARMLVSSVPDPFLIKRYALAEAVAMNGRLREESLEFIVQVAEQLDVRAVIVDGTLRIRFTDYLRFTSRIRSKEWKLVNNELFKGFVFLSKSKFCRVLQQALQDRLEEELPMDVNDQILISLREYWRKLKAMVETWRESFKAEDFGRASIVKFPPCMKRLVAMAQAGENLPHTGRFALTSFLNFIGLSSEDIMRLFSESPDFDPSKSRYQIEHITGEISGTEYTPPECSTMKSYGICFDADSLCRHPKVNHPLTYYRIKSRKRQDVEDAQEDKAEVKEESQD
ncbi:MAG: DNA primase large subunit PriL [Methanomassiliicoccales archaeon]|nr:DNA primase large subunit PriL [Methanomassiliicoccales archaeon]